MRGKAKLVRSIKGLMEEWNIGVDDDSMKEVLSILCDTIEASPSQAVVPMLWMTDSPVSRDGSYLVGDASSGKAGGYIKVGVMHRRRTAALLTFFVSKAGRVETWAHIMCVMSGLKAILADCKYLGAE